MVAVVGLLVILLLAGSVTAFVAGARVRRWLRWRTLTPEQRELERHADALLRLTRRLRSGATVQDPESRRWFGVQRRLAVVAIGVIEADDLETPNAVVTWYLVTRWGSPEGIARVLRHQKPGGEPFGVTSREDAEELLGVECATGALGADVDELGVLVTQLQRAIGS